MKIKEFQKLSQEHAASKEESWDPNSCWSSLYNPWSSNNTFYTSPNQEGLLLWMCKGGAAAENELTTGQMTALWHDRCTDQPTSLVSLTSSFTSFACNHIPWWERGGASVLLLWNTTAYSRCTLPKQCTCK